MGYPSLRSESRSAVVADASVVINLISTGRAAAIATALNGFVVVEQVAWELDSGREKGWNHAAALEELVRLGLARRVRLGCSGLAHFERLVSGPAASTLDDGEAATIAYAIENDAVAAVDERKARRLVAERFVNLAVTSAVDLLADPAVGAALGTELPDAVFQALLRGRMRVPSYRSEWVVNLIGAERAGRCVSLPQSVRKR